MAHPSDQKNWRTSDGLELPGRVWKAQAVRGVVALVHGMGEHAGRYCDFAAKAKANDFTLVSADLRGHGRAPGEECLINHFDDYVRDTLVIVTEARRVAAGKPLFLMGHSMGGAVVLRFLEQHPEWRPEFAGLVLSSPLLKLGDNISPLLLRLAPLVAVLAPRLRAQAIDPGLISRDPVQVAAYRNDILVSHRPPPARTANQLIQAIKANANIAATMKLPLYVFHGDADALTDPQGSRDLVGAWQGADKALRLWPGSYHETLNDLDGAAVAAELFDWLGAHCES